MQPFRHHHLLKILTAFDDSRLPLDAFLAQYFRANKAVGSKDRRIICETLYMLIRWKGLIDAKIERPVTWEKRIEVLPGFKNKINHLPPHVQVSFPKFLFTLLGENQELCRHLNEPAPTTIRANLLKTTRENLLSGWNYPCRKGAKASTAIVFDKRINFFATPEFKRGLFEIQDEASQLVANHIEAKPGDHVLDYCAGSGGKTLAIAPLMEGSGQLYLYDIRQGALREAKKRLKRAGIQNAQILSEDKLQKLQGKMDWVLVDAPCSGTGTLRRNPDMKWRLTPAMIERLTIEQRTIFANALKYLKPNGTIVYATCSVLACENQEQIDHFQKVYNLKLVAPPFSSLPKPGEMDGFFAATLIHSKP